MDIFNPYYLQIVMFFIINAILGISIYFTLASGQLSLGAAGFMSVGAYVGALLSLKADLPIVVGILVGGFVAALVAVIIGLPTTRLKGLYLAIATLGFGEVVRVIFLNLDVTNGALGLSLIHILRAHETRHDLVCRLLLEKKKKKPRLRLRNQSRRDGLQDQQP